MKKYLALSLLITSTIFSHAIHAAIVKKKVEVSVISGTYVGEQGEAIFSYDDSKMKGKGDETIDGNEITFTFLNQTVKGKPQIALNNGKFKDVLWVASINNPEGLAFNFGFNSGFERPQFTRPSEKFIVDSKSYFGYLFPNTYVDGAGTIKYSDVKK